MSQTITTEQAPKHCKVEHASRWYSNLEANVVQSSHLVFGTPEMNAIMDTMDRLYSIMIRKQEKKA